MKTIVTQLRQLLCCLLLVLAGVSAQAQTKFIGTAYKGPDHPANNGTFFSIDPDGKHFQTDFLFPGSPTLGSAPKGEMIPYNGKLYGVTQTIGVLYEFDPATDAYKSVYEFDQPTGRLPIGPLIVYNNKFYGVTYGGGANNNGVIYCYDPAKTGADGYTLLKEFDASLTGSGTASLTVYNNKFYGITGDGGANGRGTLFSFDPEKNDASGYTKLYDFDDATGTYPIAALTVYNNKLYGTTTGGGGLANGGVFSFDPAVTGTAAYKSLYEFDGAAFGSVAATTMVVYNNKLYGMAAQGGDTGNGIMFYYDPAQTGNAAFHKFFDFDGADNGGVPYGNNISLSGNQIISGAAYGGANGTGVIFSYDLTKTGTAGYTKIVDMPAELQTQGGASITAFNNAVYGTTDYGGSTGSGTIFALDVAGKNIRVAVNFNESPANGNPAGIIAVKGKIYGISSSVAKGTIYSYDPQTKAYKDLVKFSREMAGSAPKGNLIYKDNKIYGVTTLDGPDYNGVFYSFDVVTNELKVLNSTESFIGGGSSDITLNLVGSKIYYASNADLRSYDISTNTFQSEYTHTTDDNSVVDEPGLTFFNNKLYGINGKGIFSVDLATKAFQPEYNFTAGVEIPDASRSLGRLFTFNGKIYGATASYLNGGGTIFQYDVATKTFTKIYDLTPTSTGSGPMHFFSYNNQIYGLVTGDASFGQQYVLLKFDPAIPNSLVKLQDFGDSVGSYAPQDILVYTPPTPQTITFADISKTYGVADAAPGATSTNATIPITYSSDNAAVARITTDGKLHITGAGTAHIKASQAGNDDFSDAPDVTVTLTVAKAPLTVSADDIAIVYGSAIPTSFTINYDKFVNGETAAILGAPVTAATTATASSAAGEYPITVTGPATNANYAITYKNAKLTITDGTPVIAFADKFPEKVTYGASPFDPGAISSSGTQAEYTTSDANIAVVTDDHKIKITGAGTVTITANFAAGNSFKEGAASKTVVVDPAPLTITANDATRKYKAADPVLTASYTGFVNGDNESKLITAPQFSTTASSGSLPNVYDINVCCAVSPNYTFTYVKGKLTVTGNQDVTFNPISSKTYGDASFDAGATSSSGLAPSYSSDNANVAVIEAGKVRITGAGSANITANFPNSGDYLASNATQKLTVLPHQLTIKADDQVRSQGQANPVLTASYAGFVNGDTFLSLTKQADLTTTANTNSPVGTYPINATGAQSYNGNYTIGYAGGSLSIVAARSLTFNALPVKIYGDGDFDAGVVSATSETVQYSSSDQNVATITNGKIHILNAGTTTITATLPAGNSYPTATIISQLLTVSPATLIVTASNITKIYKQNNPTLTVYYQGFVNGESASILSTQPTVSTAASASSYPGDYTLTPTGGSAKNYTLQYVPGTLTIVPETGADGNTMKALMRSRSQLDVNIYLTTQQPVNVLLYDVGGRLLNSQRPPLYKGFNTYTFDVSRYPVGTYIVKAVANDLNVSQKILVH